MTNLNEVVEVWEGYLKGISDWKELVKDTKPKAGGCGLVYELPNPIDRPNESFAVADMRHIGLTDPHKHINGEAEIYFVLQGVGKIAVGGEIKDMMQGTIIITPPDIVHITLPGDDLVLAVVNTPPFEIDNYVSVSAYSPDIAKMLDSLKSQ